MRNRSTPMAAGARAFMIALIAPLALLLCAERARAQSCSDSTKIYPLDEINSSENELAPTWDDNSGEKNGSFYFERGASWYLDSVGHRLMQTSITSPKSGNGRLPLELSRNAAALDLPGLPIDRFEVSPAMIPGGGATQLLYCGVADLEKVRTGSPDKANIHLFERMNGRFVEQSTGGTAQLLRINGASTWESHPAALHNVIFFASDRPGGKGGIDIWYVVRTGQTSWSEPINAADINTSYNEISPCLPPDNARTLYFSSDRPRQDSAQYGFDIYAAHRVVPNGEGSTLQAPLSFEGTILMPCVNTRYHELFYMAIDANRGFYASDSPRAVWNGAVNFDLYQVVPNPMPPHVATHRLQTFNPCDRTRGPVVAEFEVLDVTNGRNVVVAEGKVNDQDGTADIRFFNAYRNNEGEFILRPRAGDNYFSVPIRIRPGRVVALDSIPIWSVRFEEGCPIQFRSLVQFESGSSIMQRDDTVRLLELVDQMNRYLANVPDRMAITISIDGHTDDRPTSYRGVRGAELLKGPYDLEHNGLLSNDRAKHVREFLESRLMRLDGRIRFNVRGHSYFSPLVDYRVSVTDEQLDKIREQNRRVEIQMRVEGR